MLESIGRRINHNELDVRAFRSRGRNDGRGKSKLEIEVKALWVGRRTIIHIIPYILNEC